MDPVTIGIGLAAAVSAIVGGISAGASASSAAGQKAALMRQQAQFGVQQSGIGLEQKQIGQTQLLGRSTAAAGASGFTGGTGKTSASGGMAGPGTMADYLTQVAKNQQAGNIWDAYAAAKTAGFQETAADITQSTGNAQLFSDTLSGASSGLNSLSRVNWFGGQT
jgi:hypothetical protein